MSSSAREDDPDVTNTERATLTANVEHCIRQSKGVFIAGGASGIVERLLSGDIIKSPWPGARANESRRDLTVESDIYKKLGDHPRLIHIFAWDPEECSLIMEYMPNGCLKDYLLANNEKVTTTEPLRWVLEAAEGLQLLHSANVIHCDVEPKNFLLDEDLSLKIADFSGSSLDNSIASACAGTRFLPPGFDWRSPPTIRDDMFGLGSTIYTIMTGRYPFHEISSREVERLYAAQGFPDVSKIPCGEAIQRCWLFEIDSAQEVYNFIKEKITTELCKISPHSN